MTEQNKKIEIEFMPGCFDNFEGTQEELDQMIAEIQRLADSGELFEKAEPIDVESMLEELKDEQLDFLSKEDYEPKVSKKLH